MKKLLVWLFAALASLAVLLGTFIAAPAHAAQIVTRPPQPGGDNMVWGYPIASLGACSAVNQLVDGQDTNGAWDIRSMVGTNVGTNTLNRFVRPLNRIITEPCFDSTASGINRLKFGVYNYALPYAASPLIHTADVSIGHRTDISVQARVFCSSTEWSNTAPTIIVGTGGTNGSVQSGQTGSFSFSPFLNFFTSGTCNFIQKIEVPICVYGPGSNPGWVCTMMTWTSERAFRDPFYPVSNPQLDICKVRPDHSDCVYILPDDNIDGTDFDVVCANQPMFEVPDWDGFNKWVPYLVDWWNAAIAHYGRCLFVPVNGFDRDDYVYNQWVRIGINQASESIQDALFGWSFYEACGSLITFPLAGSPVAINTCDIPASVANPIKQVIQIVVGIGSLLGYVYFGSRIVTGVANRKIVSPDLDTE